MVGTVYNKQSKQQKPLVNNSGKSRLLAYLTVEWWCDNFFLQINHKDIMRDIDERGIKSSLFPRS